MKEKEECCMVTIKFLKKYNLIKEFISNTNSWQGTQLKNVKELYKFMLLNYDNNPNVYNKCPIVYCFDWGKSEEGFYFWSNLIEKFNKKTKYKFRKKLY